VQPASEPRISYIGPTAVWWIPKPRGPRTSVRNSLLGWCFAGPVTIVTLLWIHAQGDPLWPFMQNTTTPAQMVLRYEIFLLVYLTYISLRSLPGWWRYRRQARRDVHAIDEALRSETWERAALLVHRYCLCVYALWHRLPGRVTAWDSVLQRKIGRHRRLHLYYSGAPPVLPTNPRAGFTPEIVPPNQPSKIALIGLVPIALLLYLVILEVVRRGQWELMLTFNVVLLFAVLVSYGGYFILALLGRSHHYRLAPGVLQVVRFAVIRRRPRIVTYDLRASDISLDVSAPWAVLHFGDAQSPRRRSFRFPRTRGYVEAMIRAVLSTAPHPVLPSEGLLE
jgi:hypothetical protein